LAFLASSRGSFQVALLEAAGCFLKGNLLSELLPTRRFVAAALLSCVAWMPATSSAEGTSRTAPGTLHFEVPHSLPLQKAMHRVELLTTYWADQYGVRTRWAGFSAELSGRVLGIRLDAHLEVKEGSVGGDVSDPGFFFRGTARSYLYRKFTTYLDPKNDW
jgi:hypothetical protein